MSNEEKVKFLMRLAVETHNARVTGRLSSPRQALISQEPISEIEGIYHKYEELFDKLIAE